MTTSNRRDFLRGLAAITSAGATLSLPPSIRRALAIAPHRVTGTIRDVEHVVILMQENRSFDHYFGTLAGVRGFGERFPIPLADANGLTRKTIWNQPHQTAGATSAVIAPFPLNTEQTFQYMRVSGTPHSWRDAQYAWADGRMNLWPRYKANHSLGYFTRADIPFQYALAEAFTICDAYHCSFQGGTNPNRLFLWTGTNDGLATGKGPAINNSYDNLEHDPDGGYTWVTYTERLENAGVSWQIYQNMADNFTDNPVAGFRTFRDAYYGLPGGIAALKEKGLTTRDLDKLKEDVLGNQLPQVSWVVATAEGSEHPGPSSPAQGADYTAKVLDALTANPDVWSKTVLFVNFDENDGFFDHVPPPAAPSYVVQADDPSVGDLAGDSTADTDGEYHEFLTASEDQALQSKPYGLGPRVPMYVVSPWSKGGWVNSEVFDHTSVIRFLEKRFGVLEPNISDWRRAVCGDLTTAFDFADPDNAEFFDDLPDTVELADRARALPSTSTPPVPAQLTLPVQDYGTRPSRALPYELHVHSLIDPNADYVQLSFANTGAAGACFHVYDRNHLDRVPRRYTVEPGKRLTGAWTVDANGAYDLWVIGPNGFHRHFSGDLVSVRERRIHPEVKIAYKPQQRELHVTVINSGKHPCLVTGTANSYFFDSTATLKLFPGQPISHGYSLKTSANWYDFSITVKELPGFLRRFAGRIETGKPSFSDPALGGVARGDWT